MSLAIDVLVCSVKSYLEVSSRDYLGARDQRVCLLFGSWFRTPTPRKKNRNCWKTVIYEKKFISVRDGPVKRTETRQG